MNAQIKTDKEHIEELQDKVNYWLARIERSVNNGTYYRDENFVYLDNGLQQAKAKLEEAS